MDKDCIKVRGIIINAERCCGLNKKIGNRLDRLYETRDWMTIGLLKRIIPKCIKGGERVLNKIQEENDDID